MQIDYRIDNKVKELKKLLEVTKDANKIIELKAQIKILNELKN